MPKTYWGWNNKKPNFVMDMRANEKAVICVKFIIAGKEEKIKYTLYARQYGELKVEKELRNYG